MSFETFTSPVVDRVILKTDMVAMCPFVPGQRDDYRLTIEYTPEEDLIEAVSLKRWLETFREVDLPAEELLVRIRDEIEDRIAPAWLLVTLVHEVAGVEITVVGGGA